MKLSRREFLESSAAAVAVAGTAGSAEPEKKLKDGPRAKGFSPLPLTGNTDFDALAESGISDEMAEAVMTRIDQIVEMGVVATPGLVVDGEVKSSGKVLSAEEIKALLA